MLLSPTRLLLSDGHEPLRSGTQAPAQVRQGEDRVAAAREEVARTKEEVAKAKGKVEDAEDSGDASKIAKAKNDLAKEEKDLAEAKKDLAKEEFLAVPEANVQLRKVLEDAFNSANQNYSAAIEAWKTASAAGRLWFHPRPRVWRGRIRLCPVLSPRLPRHLP